MVKSVFECCRLRVHIWFVCHTSGRFTNRISDNLQDKKGLWFGWLERCRLCAKSEKCSIAGGALIVLAFVHNKRVLLFGEPFATGTTMATTTNTSTVTVVNVLIVALCSLDKMPERKKKLSIMMTSFRYYCCPNNFYLTVSQQLTLLLLLLPNHKISNERQHVMDMELFFPSFIQHFFLSFYLYVDKINIFNVYLNLNVSVCVYESMWQSLRFAEYATYVHRVCNARAPKIMHVWSSKSSIHNYFIVNC